MKPKFRKILRVAGIVLGAAILVVIAFSLYAYFHKPFLKNYVERTLAKTSGMALEIGRLDYRIFPLRVEAEGITLEMKSDLGDLRIRAEKAEGRGSLRNILRRIKPLLSSLKVTGLEVEFDQPADLPPSEPMSVRDMAAMGSDALSNFGKFALVASNVRLDFKAMGLAVSFEGLDFEASTGAEEGSYRIDADRVAVLRKEPGMDIAAAVRSSGTWRPRTLDWLQGDLSFRDATISLPEKNWAWDEQESTLEAAFVLDADGASVSRIDIGVPGLASISGSGRTGWGSDSAFDASLRIGVEDIARARGIMEPLVLLGLPGLSAEGAVSFEGDLRREIDSGARTDIIAGTLGLPSLRVAYRAEGLEIDETLRGEFRLEGPLTGPRAKGRLEGTDGSLRSDAVRIEGLSFSVPVVMSPRGVDIPGFEIRAVKAAVGPAAFSLEGPLLAGKAVIDLEKKTAEIPSLELRIPDLGKIELDGKGNFRSGPVYSASLETTEIDIAGAAKLLSPLFPESAAQWNAAGRFNLTLDVQQISPGRTGPEVSGNLKLSALSFQNPPGNVIAEGIEPRFDFSADLDSSTGVIPFRLRFELAKGESLWNEAYFNWETQPLRLEGRAEFDQIGRGFRGIEATLGLSPLGDIAVAGSTSFGPGASTDIRVSVPSFDLSSLAGFLSTLRPTQSVSWDLSGSAGLDFHLRLARRFIVQGLLRIIEGKGTSKGGSSEFSGLSADIPFSLSDRQVRFSDDEDFFIAPGRIRIEKFRTSSFDFEPLEISFLSTRNLLLLFPVELSLWGTEARLGKSVVSINPAASSVRGTTSVSLGELDLSRLTEASETLKITGKASIPESRLVILPGELLLDGTLYAEVFGGKATVRNVRARDAFSESRVIFFDAEIKGLDLEKLTDAVPFGRVTGIVDITIGDFALSFGQPESFDLRIETVPAKGVSKKFSLKAVDDLQVISSGEQSAMASSGFFTRFISSFNYERIGIACSLRNDIFTLQSTIVEGGVHYLVRRSPLFGIDVVNKKPVNRIGFKDMMGRLNRVGQSQEKK